MLKVIIVDDEQFIAQGLQALIDWNAAGYEVAAVLSDGQEALEYIKKLPVDLVITDVMMPKMTGLELLETVRRVALAHLAQGLAQARRQRRHHAGKDDRCDLLRLRPIQGQHIYDFI